jgi:hypothetical protein
MCKKCASKEVIIDTVQELNSPDYHIICYCSECFAPVETNTSEDLTEDLLF